MATPAETFELHQLASDLRDALEQLLDCPAMDLDDRDEDTATAIDLAKSALRRARSL